MSCRLAIDASWLVGWETSIATYTEELVEALIGEACEPILLAPCIDPGSRLERFLAAHPELQVLTPGGQTSHDSDLKKMARWYQITIPRLVAGGTFNVVLSMYHQIPIFGIEPGTARISIIHDCCGLRPDCGYRSFGRAWLRHWFNLKSAAQCADRLIPISGATRTEYVRHFPATSHKISEPIYNQVSVATLDESEVYPELARLGLARYGYVLCFPIPGKRKGTDIALRAYSTFRRAGGTLPIVMIGGDQPNLIEWGMDPAFLPDVIQLGRVSDHTRDALYSGAACFLFFSRCEGFGYPIIEAARQGCPVVAWKQGTAGDLLGDTIPLMEQLVEAEGAQLIHQFATLDSNDRTITRETLIERSQRFNRPGQGARFMQVIREAIAHRRSISLT